MYSSNLKSTLNFKFQNTVNFPKQPNSPQTFSSQKAAKRKNFILDPHQNWEKMNEYCNVCVINVNKFQMCVHLLTDNEVVNI